MKNWKRGFLDGIIYSTALLLNTYNEGTAENLWGESGCDKDDLMHGETNDSITVYNYFYGKKQL